MDNIAIGNYLTKLREQAGYTQTEVGNLIGVSNKTISKWECGDGLPNYDSLLALASLYHVATDEIIKAGDAVKIERPEPNNPPIAYLVMQIIAVVFMSLFAILFLSLGSIVDARASFALALISLAVGLSLHLVSVCLYGEKPRIKTLEAFNIGLLFLSFLDAMICFSTVWAWGLGGAVTMALDLCLGGFFLQGLVPAGLIAGLFAFGFAKGNSFGENVRHYGHYIVGGFLSGVAVELLILMVQYFQAGLNWAGCYLLVAMLVAIVGLVICFIKQSIFEYVFTALMFLLCFIGIFVTTVDGPYDMDLFASGMILMTIESATLFGLRFLSRLARQ